MNRSSEKSRNANSPWGFCLVACLALVLFSGCSQETPRGQSVPTRDGSSETPRVQSVPKCDGSIPLTPNVAARLGLTPQSADRLRALGVLFIPTSAHEVSVLIPSSQISESDFEILGTMQSLSGVSFAIHGIDGDWLRHLANAKKLRYICIGGDNSTSACNLNLLGQLDGLQTVELRGALVTRESIEGLASLPHLYELKIIDCQLQDDDLAPLAGATKLTTLWLIKNPITSAGIDSICKLPNLRILQLEETQIDDRAVELLSMLPSLRMLDLQSTSVTDQGCKQLLKFPNLRYINLRGTRATDRGVEDLKRRKTVQVIWNR